MAGQLAGRGERAGSLGHGRRGDREGTDARRAARAGAPRAGRAGERAPAGAGQRPRRDEPGRGGAGRRHGPADPARLGAPLQRGRGRGPARPAAAGSAVRARRGPAGRPEGPDPAGSEAGARRLRRLARPRPARAGRAPVRGPLRRERGQAAAQGARPLLAEGAARPPRGGPEGAGALQKKLPDLIRGVADRHPEAERVELWFMDEARIGRRAASRTSGTREGRVRAGCASRASPRRTCSAPCARGAARASRWCCPRSRPRPWTCSSPSCRARSRPGPTPRWCSTAPAGTSARGLAVPANPTLIHPPPYSPELNPVERVWEYLRDRWLSQRVLAGGHEAVVDAACAAWNALLAEPGRLRSLTSFPWLPSAVSTS